MIAPSTELARFDRLQEAAPRLDLEQIARLSRVNLALLELSRLRDPAVVHLMRKQVMLRDWKRACLAVEEIARRHGRAFADGHLEDVAHEAFIARQYDVAEHLLGQIQDPTAQARLRADLDLARRTPESLAQLEADALAALKDEGDPLDVAFTTLHTWPALGILIARGMLHDSGALERETLADAIEDARDVLLLPPGDPVAAHLETLDGARETALAAPEPNHAKLTRTTVELQAKLDHAAERLVSLQRQVDDRERELARAERAAQAQNRQTPQVAAVADPRPPQAADPRDQRALRDKIENLQARIREGNEERARLRRQLSEAAAAALDGSAAAQTDERHRPDPEHVIDDDAESIPFVSTNRALLFPQFTDTAKTALGSVPRNVAAQAMRTIANLAAGDPAAWRIIKQAKDMRRQVLMARVGIHHRLLFRVENNVLDVLDIVTRESLLTNLKRMRSG